MRPGLVFAMADRMMMPKLNSCYVVAVSLSSLMSLCMVTVAGCASMGSSKNTDAESSLSANGPSVVYARSEPGTVELNRDFQPTKPAEVLADIKDFQSPISDVKLQFTNVPLEVPMENIGGTTWRAQFSPRQLEMLAVSGRTTHYEANVIARNKEGKTSVSKNPISVAIKAPDMSIPAATGAG